MKYSPIIRSENHFQSSLEVEKLIHLCSVAFPDEKNILEIKEFDSGFFNNTYCIMFEDSNKVILRIAPFNPQLLFSHEHCLMRREHHIHSFFGCISECIPRILFSDFTHRHIDRDYMFQSFIEGTSWGEIQNSLSKEENALIWSQLGNIAKRLNRISNDHFGSPYPSQSFQSWSSYYIQLVENRLKDAQRFGFSDSEIMLFLCLIKKCKLWLDEISIAKLCHGDLWPNNILLNQAERGWEITGILDIERAYWGDPLAEWTFSTFDYPESFWNTYGEREMDFGAKVRSLIYKGDSLIISILESIRFQYTPPYEQLHQINLKLKSFIIG